MNNKRMNNNESKKIKGNSLTYYMICMDINNTNLAVYALLQHHTGEYIFLNNNKVQAFCVVLIFPAAFVSCYF